MPGQKVSNDIQKLLKISILCEQWPYRISLLIQTEEGSLRKSLLEIQKIIDPSTVSIMFEGLELKLVSNHVECQQNTDLHEMIKKEKIKIKDSKQSIQKRLHGGIENIDHEKREIQNANEKVKEDEIYLNNLVAFSRDVNKAFSYWEEIRDVSMKKWRHEISEVARKLKLQDENIIQNEIPSLHNKLRQEIEEMVSSIEKDFEKQLKDHYSQLSLFDICCQVEKKALQIADNNENKHSISRDGDCHVFQQLLAEDSENDKCVLKIIDLALPNQFENEENNNYKSLRPFIINLSRHMLERVSKLNESLINETHKTNECQHMMENFDRVGVYVGKKTEKVVHKASVSKPDEENVFEFL